MKNKDRIFFLVLGVVFLALCVAGIHGFSIPVWYGYLGGKAPDVVLFGTPQDVRSDDWITITSLALSELSHDPKFPRINHNLGGGLDLLAPYSLPIAHWITFFRPLAWGFFASPLFGADFGFAWLWWGQIFGLFCVWSAVFLILTKGERLISALGALLLLGAPFFQYWAWNASAFVIYAGLGFVGFAKIVAAKESQRVWPWGFLLGWSTVAFAVNIYPPYQVSTAYALIFLSLGFAWQHLRVEGKIAWKRSLLVMGGAFATAGALVVLFLLQTSELRHIMGATVYPGHRVSTGGELGFAQLFSANFFANRIIRDWRPGSNICEISSFYVIFPPIVFGALAAWTKKGLVRNRMLAVLGGFIALSLGYFFIGIPVSAAQVSGMGFVPATRHLLGFGVGVTAFLVIFLKELPEYDLKRVLIGGGVGAILMAWGSEIAGHRLQSTYSEYQAGTLGFTAVGVGLASLFLLPSLRKVMIAIVAIGVLLINGNFNPLVRNSTDYLYNNRLSRKISQLHSADPEAKWVTYGSIVISNLPRILGAPAINGIFPYPDFETWRALDPEGKFTAAYNRYAHVVYEVSPTSEIKVGAPQADTVVAEVPPNHPGLAALGVKYFIVVGPSARVFDNLPDFKRVFAGGDKRIYRWDREVEN